jgi:CheY-like chemotaxis protein
MNGNSTGPRGMSVPNILIIDDDKLVREAAQLLLRAKGFEVSVAADGKSGIAAAATGRFDLAIVDLFMPGMDGLKVMQAIRAANPTLPMIAASGFMFGAIVRRCPNSITSHPTPARFSPCTSRFGRTRCCAR